jgi:hypothetical protein
VFDGDVEGVKLDHSSTSVTSLATEEKKLLFGANSVVSCILDTDASGGTLSFELDGQPITFRKNTYTRRGQQAEILENFTNAFERLENTAALYPIVMTCPLDELYEDLEEENRRFKDKQQKEKTVSMGASKPKGDGSSDDGDMTEGDGEITPDQLKKIAKYIDKPVSTLKKMDSKDLHKLWNKVELALEAMRV